jgi:hypothetical protein
MPVRSLMVLMLMFVAVLAFFANVYLARDGYVLRPDVPAIAIGLVFAAYLIYALVGSLIVVHRPGNVVGWLVGAMGFFPLVGNLAGQYAGIAHVRRESTWPLLDPALWLNSWYFYAVVGLLPMLLLLYPDGRPASPRLRMFVWLSGGGLVLLLLVGMFAPTGTAREPNPYALDLPSHQSFSPVMGACVLLGLVGGIISLAVRYRRARGVERQQVTWLLYGAVVAACILSFDDLLPVDVAFPISFALPALTIGVAVLRYRLYDIDRIVSRTVAYGVLTALLAVPYLVVVTFASKVGGSNDLAVAVATLAAAAAFNPLRRRVQHRVDRLFNRARYDAGRTVEAFSHRLREEVDLRSVHEDLLAVVRQTVEPSSASLWLRQRP